LSKPLRKAKTGKKERWYLSGGKKERNKESGRKE